MNSVTIFLDTNVFIHYRSLEDIDWSKVVSATEIKIVLFPVNFRELNKLKDDHQAASKTRQRASSSLKLLKRLLDENLSTKLPSTVKVRFDSQNPPQDVFDSHYLVTYIPDDHFLASIIQYQKRFESEQIVFITHDVGVQQQSKPLSIKTAELPISYKIPDEPDEEQVKIRQLERELQRFKSRVPDLRIRFDNGSHEMCMPIESELGRDFIDDEMRAVKIRYPHKKPIPNYRGFHIPSISGLLDVPSSEYERYNQEIDEYYNLYSVYLEKMRDCINQQRQISSLPLSLENIGTLPASDIDISIKIKNIATLHEDYKETKKPQEPQLPEKPQTVMQMQNLRFSPLLDYSSPIHDISKLYQIPTKSVEHNVSCPSVTNLGDETEFKFHVKKLKHNSTEILGEITLEFMNVTDMKNFSLHYTINSHEAIDDFKGQLIVKFKHE